ALLLIAGPARAVDHNNIDAHRPLSFDDADALAYREQALEFGLNLGWPRRRPLGLGMDAEYLYGFRMNSHLTLGFEPSIGGRAGEESTAFDVGDVSLGLFHNFNRQHGNTPAFSLRGDVFAPTGRGSRGVAGRLRGIMSKQAGQYGSLHLNVDLNANPGAPADEREFHPGVVLGYSRPVGYPTHFTTTGLAELSVRAGEDRGTGPVFGIGVGIRKQVGFRSVLDLGIQSDIAGSNGAPRDRVRLVAGYSYGF
ncbi:MAG TPA: transporter, partial [Armatimonadota bacterium]|nr:transporter [Armatimonadota bacterium]